jgi:hypothetical protein
VSDKALIDSIQSWDDSMGPPDRGREIFVWLPKIQTAVIAPRLYPESQWKIKTAGHPHDERLRHVGIVSAGSGTHRGDRRRSQLLCGHGSEVLANVRL